MLTSQADPPGAFSRFERIETLPGLPEEDTARGILESLAADPGVRAVMQKHRWTVGALCELYPEGKVREAVARRMGLKSSVGGVPCCLCSAAGRGPVSIGRLVV